MAKLSKTILHHPITRKVMGWLLVGYAKAVFGTSKVVYHGPTPPKQAMFVLWHQNLVLLPKIIPEGQRVTALMSPSRDGQLIAYPAGKLGISTATGSSSRKAVEGIRALLRAAKRGDHLVITPDGPRGPAKVAKEGATEVARMTKLPLIPVWARSTRGHHASSWDSMHIPWPFGTIHVVYGTPLTTLGTKGLENALMSLEAEAIGYTETPPRS